jgi:hypothetical protein
MGAFLAQQPRQFGANRIGAFNAGNVVSGVLHHIARAVIPRAQIRPEVNDGHFEIARNRAREVGEFAGAGLDVEGRKLGSNRQKLGVDAGVELRSGFLELLLEALAQFGGAILGDELVVRSIGGLGRLGGLAGHFIGCLELGVARSNGELHASAVFWHKTHGLSDAYAFFDI